MWDFAKQHEERHHIYSLEGEATTPESQVWHMQRGILKEEEDNRAANSASGRLVALENGQLLDAFGQWSWLQIR